MKKALIIMSMLALSGCGTLRQMPNTVDAAVTEDSKTLVIKIDNLGVKALALNCIDESEYKGPRHHKLGSLFNYYVISESGVSRIGTYIISTDNLPFVEMEDRKDLKAQQIVTRHKDEFLRNAILGSDTLQLKFATWMTVTTYYKTAQPSIVKDFVMSCSESLRKAHEKKIEKEREEVERKRQKEEAEINKYWNSKAGKAEKKKRKSFCRQKAYAYSSAYAGQIVDGVNFELHPRATYDSCTFKMRQNDYLMGDSKLYFVFLATDAKQERIIKDTMDRMR